MNVIVLSGNLCKDIEVRKTKNDKSIVTNTIAVKKDFKNEEGEYETDFVNIILFDHNAEYLSKYAKKGDKINIVGKMRVDKYKDENEKTHVNSYVVVDKLDIFNRRDK